MTALETSPKTIDFWTAQLAGPELHQLHTQLRQAGPIQPIQPIQFMGQAAYIIVGFEALRQAFQNGEIFPPETAYQMSTELVMGRTFISMPQEPHNVYRKLATPAFRQRAVANSDASVYGDIAHQLIDRIIADDEADLVESFTRPFPLLVISRMLGFKAETEQDLRRWSEALLAFTEHPEPALQASREISELLQPLIQARRAEPQDDVLSELCQAHVDGQRLSDEEIISHIRLLFPTGADTTWLALGNLLYAILCEAELWHKLQQQPSLRPQVIEEMLRWEPPTASIPRLSAGVDTHFQGVELPANSLVLFGIGAANRDPEAFEQPNVFDPMRDSSHKLTFGPGLRTCPGMHLARKEMGVALDVLLQRLPQLNLIDTEKAKPRGAVLRGPQALQARW